MVCADPTENIVERTISDSNVLTRGSVENSALTGRIHKIQVNGFDRIMSCNLSFFIITCSVKGFVSSGIDL